MFPGVPLLALLLAIPPAYPAIPPQTFAQVTNRAEAARTAGRVGEAIVLYQEAVRLRPAWEQGWWELGMLFYEQDRFLEAASAFKRFTKAAPQAGPAYAFLGLCEYQTGDHDQALSHFQMWARAGFPGADELQDVGRFHWALLLTRKNRFAEALNLLGKQAGKRRSSPGLAEAMGLAALRIASLPEQYPVEQREMVWLAGKAALFASLPTKEFEYANEYAGRLVAHYPQAPNVHYFRGMLLTLQNKPAEAQMEFEKELQISPEHVPAMLASPVAAAQPSSVSASRKRASANSMAANFAQLSQAADRARLEVRDDEAIGLYRQALQLRPDWPEGLWYLGGLLYQQQKHAEARDVLRRYLTQAPGSGPGWALLGMSEYQTREYPRALDHLRRAMSMGVGERQTMRESMFRMVSILLTRFEQYDDSMRLLIAMVKSGSESGQPAEPLVEPIGLAALRFPFLPSEIPADRSNLVAMAGQATLALESNRQDEAERLFQRMVTEYPNEPGVHFLYGAFLMGVRGEEAVREMQRELEIAPSSLPARLRLAEQYVKEERPDEALPLTEEAVRLAPQNGLAHMMLGEVLVAKRDLAAGIQRLESARELSPDTVRIHWDLLRAYTAAGRSEDAKREKEQIEKLSRPGQ